MINLMPQASVSHQLLLQYRLDIVSGKYPPGSQFPTVRALAYEESVNPNTMQKVLAMLEQDGLVISHGTKGRFVTEDTEIIDGIKLLLQTEYLKRARDTALQLGITKQQFMQFLQESEDNNV
ncbi:MAG: GntR family transcriptional regulator [Ruminococcaceae bacterium]|nr:GntR family transcriptional regulator [Oscillospiraceae bacterium]